MFFFVFSLSFPVQKYLKDCVATAGLIFSKFKGDHAVLFLDSLFHQGNMLETVQSWIERI